MKRPRNSTIAGTLTGVVLIAAAMIFEHGCTGMPQYATFGLTWSTLPPGALNQPTPTPAVIATPTAAARP